MTIAAATTIDDIRFAVQVRCEGANGVTKTGIAAAVDEIRNDGRFIWGCDLNELIPEIFAGDDGDERFWSLVCGE